MKKTFFQFDNIFLRMRMGTCVAFLVCSFPVFAQEAGQSDQSSDTAAVEKPKTEEVVLPGAEVRAQRETAEHISQEEMTERGDTNLFEAIRWIPGIVTHGGHGGTDTAGLSIRGIGGGTHDTDYLTIMQDGTPLSDMSGSTGSAGGRFDFFGMLTGGLESIDVAKGYTSVLLGPDIMAGVLMMRTAKPKRKFELDSRFGFDFDAGGFGGTTDTLTVGTRLGMFYARASLQEKYVDHWRLPDSFVPEDNDIPVEEGGQPQKAGNRIFTNSNSLGANVMFGINPIDTLDIWATYSYSTREIFNDGFAPVRTTNSYLPDGSPLLNGMDPRRGLYMGSYPYRNRHDATIHAEWAAAEKLNLALHGYFNLYDQRSNGTWNNTGVPPNPVITSWNRYLNKEYQITDTTTNTFGVNLRGAYEISDMHKIEATFQFKQNNYETWSGYRTNGVYGVEPEHTDEYQTSSYKDNVYFWGAEYTINPFKNFTGIAGFGLDMNDPQKLDRWTNTATTHTKLKSDISNFIALPQWSIGAFYDLTEDHEVHLTYAKKNRFATFYERGNAEGTDNPSGAADVKPNLDLKPQQVHHFEIGYKGYFFERIRLTSAIYTNYELNKIARVDLENDPDGYERQYRNIDENLYYGFELGTEIFLNDYFTMGGSFTMSKYKILHNEANERNTTDTQYIGTSPVFVTNGYCSISPFAGKDLGIVKNIRIMPRFEYVGERLYASDGNQATEAAKVTNLLDDYVLVHLGFFADIAEHYSVSFSIHNLFDELYSISLFYPGQGRSFNISLGAKF